MLIVSNHVSWVDIVVLASVAPMVFVAKREVRVWPLIGAAAKVQKVVFVDRDATPTDAGDTCDEIAQRLAEGHPVVLFAEGTSSDGNRVLPFRSALIGAVGGGLRRRRPRRGDVQPMSICYTAFHGMPMGRQRRPLVAWYGDLDFFPHFAAFLRARRRRCGGELRRADLGRPPSMTARTWRSRLEIAVRTHDRLGVARPRAHGCRLMPAGSFK